MHTTHHRVRPQRVSRNVTPAAYARRVNLTATIRTRPADHRTDLSTLTMDVITATADDYDTAKAELEGRVPDGWQMLSLRSDG